MIPPAAKGLGQRAQDGEGNRMFSWVVKVVPQPPEKPGKLGDEEKNNAAPEENAVSNRAGVINWIVQGLGKVVPQPDDKYKQQTDSQEVTEAPKEVPEAEEKPAVHDAKDLADAEPLPQIAVVEVVSDEEPDADGKNLTPRVMEWIKHGFEKVVPQPSPVHSPEPTKKETPAAEPPPAPAPVSAPAPSPAEPPKAEEGTKGGTA
ncbi:hypothetical protein AOLI_G00093160 [Acnodon oligacanthus]